MNINLMDLVQSQLSGGLLDQIAGQIGGDKQKTEVASNAIMTTLMSAMAKNASTPEGANSLANALDRDHDGGLLDNVMDLFSGNQNISNQRAANGAGILNHLLGGKQSGIIDTISKLSGLDNSSTGSLMLKMAPMIMGMLGKTKKQHGLDAGGIASLLNHTQKTHIDQNEGLGFIGQMLDADGDGSIVDDVAGMGMKFLGGFFGRK